MGRRNVDGLKISHLLFADDTLIFYEENPYHLHYLQYLFLSFNTVSGLKINMAKSKLVPNGNANNVGLARTSGRRVSS